MSDRRGDAFQRALDEARRKERALNDRDLEPSRRPHVGVGVAFGQPTGSGGKARFGLALDWTDEPTDRPGPPPQPPPPEAGRHGGDTPAEIAAQLGLGAPATLGELASRWRAFVWRNHPDRQPVEQRERANARVTIANALYQRARRELAKAQPSPARAAK
jgi:hypothetical protein